MKVLIYILIAIFVIGACLTIDYKIGRKKYLPTIKSNAFPFRESNIELFTHGTDLFNHMFDDFKNAKKHIHVLFYICNNDEFGNEFLTILKEKAEEGVEVRLLLDWAGSLKVSRKMIKELKSAGVEFAFSNVPTPPFYFYSSQARNHRKITVIDGSIGYLGGYNVGNEYIDLDPKLSPWRDYHLRITAEGVVDLQKQFLLDWQEAAKTNLLQNKIYFPPLGKGTSRHRIISTEGFLLENTFSTLIHDSKKSILIGSPYFIPSERILKDLLDALRRGVELTIIVPYLSDHMLVKEASYPYLRAILAEGANVYQFKNGFYHAKILLFDDEICDIGTANFDNRSFFLNHEINCYIHDPKIIDEMKRILDKDMKDSDKLTLEDLNSIGFMGRVKEWIAGRIDHFL
ncbi:cardiolipin synthase [Robertmurraya massiliosenegalensis]|uniref:cardiolipin synthase n=1 Tax=Robertmurraya massiliosenegalensis TaxID=1287657 RepID=UPI0002F1A74E|nr:cardiolipin synthase [Robertmurraya massiliosenegalensis]